MKQGKTMRKIFPVWITLIALSGSALHALEEERIVWPSPPDPARFVFDRTIANAEDLQIKRSFWGKVWDFLAGNEQKMLAAPFGVHIDEQGKLYVADGGNQAVFVFDPVKNEMRVIEGFGDQRFVSPVDVITDNAGRIYVSDSALGRIAVFSAEGAFLYALGEGEIKIARPVGMAINNTLGRIYISDTLAGVIMVFSLEGKFVTTIGTEGSGECEFSRPTYLALDKSGNLYVSDSMNHRVQVLDPEGKFIRSFGKLGDQIGNFGSPRGITLDNEGNIYVADSLFHSVQIFSPLGELLLSIGHFGEGRGEFSSPKDIVMDGNGTLYIADFYNMRIQKLKKLPDPQSRELP